MITRTIETKLKERLFKGKAIVLFGARQVGKTTLVNKIITETGEKTLWLNGDEADVREMLTNTTSGRLKAFFGDNKIIVIDEAQRINNVGLTIKLITDQIKNVQVIATGSSAFELANSINEPLTGRKFEFNLFPFSFDELVKESNIMEEKRLLEHRLVFGYYPEIVMNQGKEKELLKLLAGSYLYKDLLMLDGLKKPMLLEKILKALALQVGSEISYNEIGNLVQAKSDTVEKYISLLEKVHVVFHLNAYSGNVRNEIRKGKKIYFYDNGIRNSILGNFNLINNRTDLGALWENFVISERIKFHNNNNETFSNYFWRSTQQQEIDYLEEISGKLSVYEIKWKKDKVKFPLTFVKAYPGCNYSIINYSNFHEYLLK